MTDRTLRRSGATPLLPTSGRDDARPHRRARCTHPSNSSHHPQTRDLTRVRGLNADDWLEVLNADNT